MVTFIVLAVVGVMVGVASQKGCGRGEKVLFGFVGLVFGLLLAVVTALKIGALLPNYHETQVIEKTELVALNNGTTIEGRFFLGSGQIDSQPAYFFYYKVANGGIKLGTLSAEGVTIFEEKRSDAYMEKSSEEDYPKITGIWGYLTFPGVTRKWECVNFHIPEGSIQRSFDLDLKNMR
ncbi:MAG: hypothetical protein ABR875_02485 [Minisyncoccia bacterium]